MNDVPERRSTLSVLVLWSRRLKSQALAGDALVLSSGMATLRPGGSCWWGKEEVGIASSKKFVGLYSRQVSTSDQSNEKKSGKDSRNVSCRPKSAISRLGGFVACVLWTDGTRRKRNERGDGNNPEVVTRSLSIYQRRKRSATAGTQYQTME